MYEKLRQFKWQDGILAAGLVLVTVIKANVSPTVTAAVSGKIVFDIEGM